MLSINIVSKTSAATTTTKKGKEKTIPVRYAKVVLACRQNVRNLVVPTAAVTHKWAVPDGGHPTHRRDDDDDVENRHKICPSIACQSFQWAGSCSFFFWKTHFYTHDLHVGGKRGLDRPRHLSGNQLLLLHSPRCSRMRCFQQGRCEYFFTFVSISTKCTVFKPFLYNF